VHHVDAHSPSTGASATTIQVDSSDRSGSPVLIDEPPDGLIGGGATELIPTNT
jgi:hypothetical protein